MQTATFSYQVPEASFSPLSFIILKTLYILSTVANKQNGTKACSILQMYFLMCLFLFSVRKTVKPLNVALNRK